MHRQNILRWCHILRKVREASASSSYTYTLGKIWIRIPWGFRSPTADFYQHRTSHYSHPPCIFTLCASLVKSYGCGPRVLHRRSKSSVAPAVGGRAPPYTISLKNESFSPCSVYFFPVRTSTYPSVSAQFWGDQPVQQYHPVILVTFWRRTMT